MHQPLQINTLFRGFAWALGLLMLLGCDPWKLPKKEFPKCDAPSAQIAHTANLLVVTFSLDSPAGTIDNVTWDFGQGQPGTGTSTTHTYTAPGTYTVKATLTNRCGQTPVVVTKQITVNNVVVPTVTTVAASAGNGASIATGVTLVNSGNAPITRFGICYSETNPNPTITDGTVDGTGTLSTTNPSIIQLGVPPLEEGKVYYIRAYATNSAGTGYGAVVQHVVPVVTGMVTHYKFSNNGLDETINANHGNTTSGAGYGTADRRLSSANGALSLNGTTGYFEVPDKQSLWDVNQLTVSLWFKPASLPTNNQRMHLYYKGKLDNPSNGGEQYSAKIGRLAGGTLQITGDAKKDGNCENGRGWKTAYDTAPNLTVGNWYHLVVVFDGIKGEVYINGTKGSNSDNLIGGIDKCQGGPLRIGAQVTGDLNPFSGQIDDFRIYNRALNKTQIDGLRHSTHP